MTSPDHPSPEGTQSASTVGPYYQNADNKAIGASKNGEMNGLLGLMQNNFFFQILGGFTSAISAVTDGITSIVEAITGIFGGTLADLDQWSSAIEDGQLALNDQVELLSPLQDYGSAYADGSGAVVNAGNPVRFNHQIGPAIGCHLSNGRWYFEDKGLWDIRARVCFSYTIGGGGQGWQIRVYRPDGTLFSYQHDGSSESGSNTREMNTTVVIPEAGYYAQVWITDLIVGRSTIGGPVYTRFTVQHISRSTVNPI